MKRLSYALVFLLITSLSTLTAQVTSPEDFFGFKPGADRQLFDYEKLIEYIRTVDRQSDRVKMVEIGESPMGKPMYLVLLSSEANISNIDRLKKINKELALNYNLSDETVNEYSEEGKVFVLATLSMHASEVGPAQASPLVIYKIATTKDPQLLSYLNDVVFMVVPSHNPDGMDLVVHNYWKWKGTKYEGTRYPGVYNKYVGHDNNRDFVTLSQSDTKAINRLYNEEWFPQVMVEKHQMGDRGVRYFVPPKHDPIAQNVDAELWTWDGVFGLNMQKDMTEKGLKGVAFGYAFDDYWPGSTETAHWKNMIAMLTEAASVKVATPVYIEDNELSVSGKGLSEYAKSANFPAPWEGGWWRLSDIVNYEITSTFSIIKTAALHKNELLELRNRLCKKEVKKGQELAPSYYIMPLKQHDTGELVRLVNLLKEHGIKVYKLSDDVSVDNRMYKKGDIVVPLAQPFRAFIKEIMEHQEFPVRHYTKGGPVIKPYDITSWSLPLHRGINVIELDERNEKLENTISVINDVYSVKSTVPEKYSYAVFPAESNDSYKAAFTALSEGLKVWRTTEGDDKISKGSFVIKKSPKLNNILDNIDIVPVFMPNDISISKKEIKMPRIALVETYMHDMDAGWTRFIFDNYGIKYTIVHPGEFENTDFIANYDVVIFPDNNKDVLKSGKYKSSNGTYSIPSYPPQYTKGIGDKGMDNLMKFFNDGGIILAWGRSAGLFTGDLKVPLNNKEKEEFVLPFNDISKSMNKSGLYCPGSFVSVTIKPGYELTLGMPEKIGVFYRGNPVFTTTVPEFDMDRRVIAKFAKEDILLSGYAEKLNLIANKSAVIWLKKNKGQMVLYSFSPQFRASTPVSYKLMFNGILLGKE
ncbi:MAG: hypothetical protein GXO47_10355 [Chlorobi bacterium]|nr:hypothetical protein [Chlorobiota bacterium]